MLRRFHMGASLRWALVIGVTCFLALGCSNSGSSRPPGVNLTGIVDDGGPNSPVPGASCVFINDTGPTVGPVFRTAASPSESHSMPRGASSVLRPA